MPIPFALEFGTLKECL